MMNKNITGTYRQIAETAREVAYNVKEDKAEYDNSELSLLAYAYSKGRAEGYQEALDIVKRNVTENKDTEFDFDDSDASYNEDECTDAVNDGLDEILSALSKRKYSSEYAVTEEQDNAKYQDKTYMETLSDILNNKENSTLRSGKLDGVVIYTYYYARKEGFSELIRNTKDIFEMMDEELAESFAYVVRNYHTDFKHGMDGKATPDKDDFIYKYCKENYNDCGTIYVNEDPDPEPVSPCSLEYGVNPWSHYLEELEAFSTSGRMYLFKYYPEWYTPESDDCFEIDEDGGCCGDCDNCDTYRDCKDKCHHCAKFEDCTDKYAENDYYNWHKPESIEDVTDDEFLEYYNAFENVKEAVMIRPKMPKMYKRIYTDYRDVIYSPDTAE
jgi:hypothetical protein